VENVQAHTSRQVNNEVNREIYVIELLSILFVFIDFRFPPVTDKRALFFIVV